MKYFLVILLSFLTLTANAGDSFFAGNLGLSFEMPTSWEVTSTEFNRIRIALAANEENEIELIRHPISKSNTISSESDLVSAIRGLFANISADYNIDDSLSYTYSHGTVTFEANINKRLDDGLNREVKLLRGMIVRTVDNQQIFYLLIGSSPEAQSDYLKASVELIFTSLILQEDIADSLYHKTDITPYLLIFLVLALTAFFYARNRRVQRSKNPLGFDSGNFWRCRHCNRVNHIDLPECGRCGRTRKETGSVNISNQ